MDEDVIVVAVDRSHLTLVMTRDRPHHDIILVQDGGGSAVDAHDAWRSSRGSIMLDTGIACLQGGTGNVVIICGVAGWSHHLPSSSKREERRGGVRKVSSGRCRHHGRGHHGSNSSSSKYHY